jgi:hypothetical protein
LLGLLHDKFVKVVTDIYAPMSNWLRDIEGKVRSRNISFEELYNQRTKYEKYKRELEKIKPLITPWDDPIKQKLIKNICSRYYCQPYGYHETGNKYLTNVFTAYQTFLDDKKRYVEAQKNGGASATKYKHGEERPELVEEFRGTKEATEYEWLIFNETVRCDFMPRLNKWAATVNAVQANDIQQIDELYEELRQLNTKLENLDFTRPDKYQKGNDLMPQYKDIRKITREGYERLQKLSSSFFEQSLN